jgi:dTDP-4-amino-4,6-dideoxygalactose transaminase
MKMEKPAIEGGKPVREKFLPYGLHWVGEEEVEAVADTLRNGWLTAGPKVKQFEQEFAEYVGAKHAVAVSSCSAALHLALLAHGVGKGDEVITSPQTFCSVANAVLHAGAKLVLADVKEDFNISPEEIAEKISGKTKAIIPTDYAGVPCDYDEIMKIGREHGLKVIGDAACSVSATYNGRKVGSICDATCFSFHPVKNMTTAEGGIITTDDGGVAEKARMLRFHGITKEYLKRFESGNSWFFEMRMLGFKYLMTDLQASIGLCQLKKLGKFEELREKIAGKYDAAFKNMPEILLPKKYKHGKRAWHIYVIRIKPGMMRVDRNHLIEALRKENIGAVVHYIPVYEHPYYEQLGFKKKDYPVCEELYETAITLPLFAKMSEEDSGDVIEAVKKIIEYYKK